MELDLKKVKFPNICKSYTFPIESESKIEASKLIDG